MTEWPYSVIYFKILVNPHKITVYTYILGKISWNVTTFEHTSVQAVQNKL